MTQTSDRVAMLGLGTMGTGMARSLLRAGIPTTVWDRAPLRTAPFPEAGATIANSPPDAARDASVAITMVTDADAVLDVADTHGMLAALPTGAIWMQMSTIGVSGCDRVAALVADQRADVLFVDAPVTGSRAAAEAGTLTIFASGPDGARTRLAPVLDALGQRTLWLGPAGLGSRLKLVNNTLVAFIAQGLGESVGLAHHLGLTTEAVIAAIDGGVLESRWLMGKLDRIAHNDFSPEFSLALALKDVKLALDTVDRSRHPVVEALAAEWQRADDEGLGNQDLTAITRVLVEPS
jgi:3-hydroxyisobutyrate dehydrogenase